MDTKEAGRKCMCLCHTQIIEENKHFGSLTKCCGKENQSNKKSLTVQEAGRKGGLTTSKKYGKPHYQKLAENMNKKKKQKIECPLYGIDKCKKMKLTLGEQWEHNHLLKI